MLSYINFRGGVVENKLSDQLLDVDSSSKKQAAGRTSMPYSGQSLAADSELESNYLAFQHNREYDF